MAGYYMLSTPFHLCVCECVGILPSDEPLLHGLPALLQDRGWGWYGLTQAARRGYWGKFQIEGNPCANFWLLWIPLWT